MNSVTSSLSSSTVDASAPITLRHADDWQRRFGVPWDRIDRAARAVLERAAAASKRKFADLNTSLPPAESRPG